MYMCAHCDVLNQPVTSQTMKEKQEEARPQVKKMNY